MLLLRLLLLLLLGMQQLKLTRRGKVEAVIIQPRQPVEIPAQIHEGHVVEKAPVVAVEQASGGTAVAEGRDVGVEVVRVRQELLEHVLGCVVEEALGGGVHEGGHVFYLLPGGAAAAPSPYVRPLAGIHRLAGKSLAAAACRSHATHATSVSAPIPSLRIREQP